MAKCAKHYTTQSLAVLPKRSLPFLVCQIQNMRVSNFTTVHSFALRTKLVAKMLPEESRGTKDCDSQAGVGLATTRTTLIQSSFRNSRQKEIGFVISGRRCSVIGRCEGPTRTGSNGNRSSLDETSGGGSSQHHGVVVCLLICCNPSCMSYNLSANFS